MASDLLTSAQIGTVLVPGGFDGSAQKPPTLLISDLPATTRATIRTEGIMARRHYGTGSLRAVGQSWIGSWYGPDGRKVKRRIGAARTPGERDGLTKAQAEKRVRARCARPSDAPPPPGA